MNMIFLIGMPLAGKTYWAKKLSEHYGIPYIDTDCIIEAETGKSVAMIFEEDGEDTFRRLEKQILDTIISENKNPLIVACGGGTPVYNENIIAMKKAGCVVYLCADIVTLTQRYENIEERNNRPLLSGISDIENDLEGLLKKRIYIYEQAHYTIDVLTASVSNFEQIIQSCINRL